MGSKRYDSYGNMSSGGGKAKVPPSQTNTEKYAGGYIPGGEFKSSGAVVRGSRLPGDGMIRKSKRKSSY